MMTHWTPGSRPARGSASIKRKGQLNVIGVSFSSPTGSAKEFTRAGSFSRLRPSRSARNFATKASAACPIDVHVMPAIKAAHRENSNAQHSRK